MENPAVVPRPFLALFFYCEKSLETLIYKAPTSRKIEFHLQNSGAFQGEKEAVSTKISTRILGSPALK